MKHAWNILVFSLMTSLIMNIKAMDLPPEAEEDALVQGIQQLALSDNPLQLMDIPTEIIQVIIIHLDAQSFSLCTRTSKQLKEICYRIPPEKFLHINLSDAINIQDLALQCNFRKAINNAICNGRDNKLKLLLHDESEDVLAEMAKTLIELALSCPSNTVLNVLLKKPAIFKEIDNQQYVNELFTKGASANNAQRIKKMFIQGFPSTHITQQLKNNTLYNAAQRGYNPIVCILLGNGAEMEAPDQEGRTALYVASENGYDQVVKTLLKHGANVNVRSDDNKPLYIASKNGHVNVVKIILDYETDVESTRDGFSALFIASERGHADVARVLLDAGARVDAHEGNGSTPLYVASQNGHASVVDVLLQSNANPDHEWQGQSPLACAYKKRNTDVWKILLRYMDDAKKLSSMLWDACKNGFTDVVEALLKAGANIQFNNASYHTPLYLACQHNHESTVTLLLEWGANPEASGGGPSPLFCAIHNGAQNIVAILLSHGANPNHPNQDITPLHCAIQYGLVAIVQSLLAAGADTTILYKGKSPLFSACELGYTEIVKLLLQYKANVNFVFFKSKRKGKKKKLPVSPLDIARNNKYHEIVEILKNHGGVSASELQYVS